MMGDGGAVNCSAAHLKAVVGLARGDDPSAVVHLPGGVWPSGCTRSCCSPPSRPPCPPSCHPPGAGRGDGGGGHALAGALRRVRCPDGSDRQPGALYLAREALAPPLVLRPRQTGDEISLPRRGGTKSLKKLFIDEKVPRRERERIPVLPMAAAWPPWRASAPTRGAPHSRARAPMKFCSGKKMIKGEADNMEHLLDRDVERVLFSEEELRRRVAEIAAEIDRDYAGKEPLLVSVLRGSFVFMADLVRQIHLPCTVDFMAVSSYGSGTSSSGQVKIVKDLSEHIEGRDLIVVEDILDSGNTLSYLLQLLQAGRRPRCGCAPCWISPPAAPSRWSCTTPVHHPRLLRGGLRPGLRREIPQPALHRGAEALGVRGRMSFAERRNLPGKDVCPA